MYMRYLKLLPLSMVLVLGACNDDEIEDKSFGAPDPVEPLIGVFLDSPVSNVDYTNATGSHVGTTNAAGEYDYLPLETMFFSIGDLDFPQVKAGAITTPMDMANSFNPQSSKITNMVRLLMTLDKDGNPKNGITITDTAKAVATQVDFDLTEEEFAGSGAVTNLIFNAAQDTVVSGLVSVEDAIAHFESQLVLNKIPYGPLTQRQDQSIQYYLSENGLEATQGDFGMYYNISVEGSGASPSLSSSIEVKYKGSLLNGLVFDQTNGNDTLGIPLTNVIGGWQLALPLMKPGGKGTFYFPSVLGYGISSAGSIPANSVLIFEIELISFSN